MADRSRSRSRGRSLMFEVEAHQDTGADVLSEERRVVVTYDDEGLPMYYSCTLCRYDYTSSIHCRCCDGSMDCGCIPELKFHPQGDGISCGSSTKRTGDPDRESRHHPRKRARNLDGVRRCHRLSRDVIDVDGSSRDESLHSSDLDEGPADLNGPGYVRFIRNAR